ncbi:MAG: hypothetical protein ACPIOQ_66160 [Promethearchaeia archaeon]
MPPRGRAASYIAPLKAQVYTPGTPTHAVFFHSDWAAWMPLISLASVFHGRSLRLPLGEKDANVNCGHNYFCAKTCIGKVHVPCERASWCARRHSRGGVRVWCGRAASSL